MIFVNIFNKKVNNRQFLVCFDFENVYRITVCKMYNLQINPLTNVSKINKNNFQTRSILPAQKPDSFVSNLKEFNIDEAMSEFENIGKSTYFKTSLFDEEQLGQIKTELLKTPEKYEPFKTLAHSSQMKGDVACRLLTKDYESLKAIAEISEISKDDYFKTSKFNSDQLETLANELSIDELNRCKILAQGIDSVYSLKNLSRNKNLKSPEKVANAIKEMKDFYGKNCSIEFSEDSNDTKSKTFVCTATSGDKTATQLFDFDMKRISLEEETEYRKNGEKFLTKKCVDYRTNTIAKTTEKVVPRTTQTELISEVRVVKGKNGKKVRNEYTTKSDIAGVPDVRYSLPNGSIENVSSATVDPKTGITTIKKNLTSLDGTKTEYSFVEDKKGNRTSNYKITDKTGKVLMDNNQKIEVISENKTISTNNDKKYEMTFTDKNVNIKNLGNGETSNIDFEKFVTGDKEVAIKLMKKLTGDELLALKKNVKQLNITNDFMKCDYSYETGVLNTCDDVGSFLHELGHAKDTMIINSKKSWNESRLISSNKEVLKTYNKEKELFYKNFPNTQRTHVSYFTEGDGFGLGEIVAEANANINYHQTEDLNAMRSQYLQQYFPKTIAAINNFEG